ncbi:trafficking protein Mon1-domain-containing protein, partial [Thermoascus aurantiacus ATCC 26904]
MDSQEQGLDSPTHVQTGANFNPSKPFRADRPVDSRSRSCSLSSEGPPPSPRPPTIRLLDDDDTGSTRSMRHPRRQSLQSKATTAVSLTDISNQTHIDGSNEGYTVASRSLPVSGRLKAKASLSQLVGARGSETDSASIRSYVPNTGTSEVESIFDDFIPTEPGSGQPEKIGLLSLPEFQADDVYDDFASEFEPIGELAADGQNEGTWKAKRKHYLILSAAGKPIWTRHGDGGLISSYIGIIQTIISFYQDSEDSLRSFSAGDTKFVILTQGPLYLVAISRILESDTQLKLQLEALYMQILSTLTLPTLKHLFSVRPSTDLKRPLQGTETLLSSLADSFTRGSPSTLLSALECLTIRKSHRQIINNALLKTRTDKLLYGLVAAGGRLVSVVRPKKHSLHPGDLQLLFNMIFEAEGVKAGGGESWIPICLPGFNSSGYLYMYVSFLDLRGDTDNVADETTTKEESVAIILISTDKEAFFDLQGMRNALVEQMENSGSIQVIKEAIAKGRPSTTDIVPGTVLRHFLYKSKANVQYTMSSYDPDFSSISLRRRLISTYNSLHASVHAKHTHVKVHHSISRTASSFAWVTPIFELYCVAPANTNRNALSQSAGKIVQWAQREEERLFIIGGAV